jgi:type II secretory pathway pseudopilin PulG
VNNKGISLIALAIMIIVMIIIASIAMNAGIDSYDQAVDAKNKEERNQVSQAVNARFGDNQFNAAVSPIVGELIPSECFSYPTDEQIIESAKTYLVDLFISEGRLQTQDEVTNKTIQKDIQRFLEENINDMQYTRILRHNDIIELGLESITINSIFLVNYYSADVVGPII